VTENVHSAWAGTALTCHRAWRHGTARFSPDRAVPGLLSQHGGTSGTARRATVPLSAVPCRAMPDRARARAGPGGPVGQLYHPPGTALHLATAAADVDHHSAHLHLQPTTSKSICRGGCRPFVGAVYPAAPMQGSLQIMHL